MRINMRAVYASVASLSQAPVLKSSEMDSGEDDLRAEDAASDEEDAASSEEVVEWSGAERVRPNRVLTDPRDAPPSERADAPGPMDHVLEHVERANKLFPALVSASNEAALCKREKITAEFLAECAGVSGRQMGVLSLLSARTGDGERRSSEPSTKEFALMQSEWSRACAWAKLGTELHWNKCYRLVNKETSTDEELAAARVEIDDNVQIVKDRARGLPGTMKENVQKALVVTFYQAILLKYDDLLTPPKPSPNFHYLCMRQKSKNSRIADLILHLFGRMQDPTARKQFAFPEKFSLSYYIDNAEALVYETEETVPKQFTPVFATTDYRARRDVVQDAPTVGDGKYAYLFPVMESFVHRHAKIDSSDGPMLDELNKILHALSWDLLAYNKGTERYDDDGEWKLAIRNFALAFLTRAASVEYTKNGKIVASACSLCQALHGKTPYTASDVKNTEFAYKKVLHNLISATILQGTGPTHPLWLLLEAIGKKVPKEQRLGMGHLLEENVVRKLSEHFKDSRHDNEYKHVSRIVELPEVAYFGAWESSANLEVQNYRGRKWEHTYWAQASNWYMTNSYWVNPALFTAYQIFTHSLSASVTATATEHGVRKTNVVERTERKNSGDYYVDPNNTLLAQMIQRDLRYDATHMKGVREQAGQDGAWNVAVYASGFCGDVMTNLLFKKFIDKCFYKWQPQIGKYMRGNENGLMLAVKGFCAFTRFDPVYEALAYTINAFALSGAARGLRLVMPSVLPSSVGVFDWSLEFLGTAYGKDWLGMLLLVVEPFFPVGRVAKSLYSILYLRKYNAGQFVELAFNLASASFYWAAVVAVCGWSAAALACYLYKIYCVKPEERRQRAKHINEILSAELDEDFFKKAADHTDDKSPEAIIQYIQKETMQMIKELDDKSTTSLAETAAALKKRAEERIKTLGALAEKVEEEKKALVAEEAEAERRE